MEQQIENSLAIGQTVYLYRSEQYWDKPFEMKRHHVYETRSVMLKGLITDIKGEEFKAKLFDNNGFERDGEEYVFNKNHLLKNKDLCDLNELGKWKYSNE